MAEARYTHNVLAIFPPRTNRVNPQQEGKSKIPLISFTCGDKTLREDANHVEITHRILDRRIALSHF